MDERLQRPLDLYHRYLEEVDRGVIGLDYVKKIIFVTYLMSLPTTMSEDPEDRVNTGLLWLLGVPGVGKTFIAEVLALITNGTLARTVGRSDQTPSDIIGYEIFNPVTGKFEVRWGKPIEANIIIADEINRAPPKTQSALIDAFQGRHVTIAGQEKRLPPASFVIATTNPVEIGEGTFPIPEALADRFSLQIDLGYLSEEDERRLTEYDITKVVLTRLIEQQDIIRMREDIENLVHFSPLLREYLVRLVRATRPLSTTRSRGKGGKYEEMVSQTKSPSQLIEEFGELGASPRATIHGACALLPYALFLGGRSEVIEEDVQRLFPELVRHRIFTNGREQAQRITVDDIINEIIDRVPIP